MQDEIQKLKLGVPIERVLLHFNQTINNNRKCKCPWHEGDNTPSLHIYPDRVYCFACGKSADIFDIVGKFTGLTNFREQKEYIMRTFSNSSMSIIDKIDTQSDRKSTLCFSSVSTVDIQQDYLHAIAIAEDELNKYTQAYIGVYDDIPEPYKRFFKRRYFDVSDLIAIDFFKNNVLFLHDRNQLIQTLKMQLGYSWKECGLFKENGNLCLLFEWSFCLLLPAYTVQSNGELVVTTIIVRNIDPNLAWKDFYFTTAHNSKCIEYDGFIGLKRAFNQYPDQVKNFCAGLIVVLVEGSTDFIAAHLLSQQFNIFGGSNEKIIILTTGGVFNTIKESNLQLIKNCSRLIIAFDRDFRGEQGFDRMQRLAPRLGLKNIERFQFRPDFKGKDLNDLLITLKTRVSS